MGESLLTPDPEVLKAYYKSRYTRFTTSAERCGWISPFTQTLRFEALTAACELSNTHILDVGCGDGALLTHLQRTPNLHYTGIDLSSELLSDAQKNHPHAMFIETDFFQITETPYTYVFAIGSWNHQAPDPYAYLEMALRKMFAMSKVATGISLLSDLAPSELHRKKTLFYYSPKKVLDIAVKITPYIELKTHYLPNDMALLLYR